MERIDTKLNEIKLKMALFYTSEFRRLTCSPINILCDNFFFGTRQTRVKVVIRRHPSLVITFFVAGRAPAIQK